MGICQVKEGQLKGLRRNCLKGFKKDKCDPVLIAAILEELGYFDEKKEKDRKGKVRGKESIEDNIQNSGEAGKKNKNKNKSFIHA